jgi:hypothetical protein
VATTQYTAGQVARRLIARAIHRAVRVRWLLLGLVVLLALLVVVGVSLQANRDSSVAPVAPPTNAAEQYIRGLQEKNAELLLGSLSPEMRQNMEQRSGQSGSAALPALFAEQERRGERLIGYRLVGEYQTVQGDRLYFYVVHARRGAEQRDIPYTLTVGSSGKVTNVE